MDIAESAREYYQKDLKDVLALEVMTTVHDDRELQDCDTGVGILASVGTGLGVAGGFASSSAPPLGAAIILLGLVFSVVSEFVECRHSLQRRCLQYCKG